MKRLVLASRSPRRAELLTLLGLQFEVRSPQVDETRHPDEEPATYVERLARSKAAAVADEGSIVVGGDTVVVHRGRVLGKPAHPAEARAMLADLSGQTHEVLSGVAVARTEGSETVVESQVASATVHFFDLLPEEIDAYVATGEPLDKAGAYALQGRGAVLVDWIRGHPSTVVGLPIPDLRRLLARAGLESP